MEDVKTKLRLSFRKESKYKKLEESTTSQSLDDLLDSRTIHKAKILRLEIDWEVEQGKDTDLDVTCLVFDTSGNLINAVYYNQVRTDDSALIHSGDNRRGSLKPVTGHGVSGDGESIAIWLDKMKPEIKSLVFLVTSFNGDFSAIKSGRARLFSGETNEEMFHINIKQIGPITAYITCIIFRDDFNESLWHIKHIGMKAKGHNFKEAESDVREVLKNNGLIPEKDPSEDPSRVFNLEKDKDFNLPNTLNTIKVILSWELYADEEVDLDASCVLFDDRGRHMETIFWDNLENKDGTIVHSGDVLGTLASEERSMPRNKTSTTEAIGHETGKGSKNEEAIMVMLSKVSMGVCSMVFTITCFTDKKSFMHVKDARVRIIDTVTKTEFCGYSSKLGCFGEKSALVMATIYRTALNSKLWSIKAIGETFNAREIGSLIPILAERYSKLITPTWRSLSITIYKAKSLPKRPQCTYYVKFEVGKTVFKTKPIKKSDPVWESAFTVPYTPEREMKVDVMCKDPLHTNDFSVGYVILKIQNLPKEETLERWFNLIAPPTKEKSKEKLEHSFPPDKAKSVNLNTKEMIDHSIQKTPKKTKNLTGSVQIRLFQESL